MYEFDWRKFTEADFYAYVTKRTEGLLGEFDFIGNVRVGELCFDLILRALDYPCLVLTYDLYVGGVIGNFFRGYRDADDPEPYAWSRIEPDYPYEDAEGGNFDSDCTALTYSEFRQLAENEFTKYIENSEYTGLYDLPARAAMPLHIW